MSVGREQAVCLCSTDSATPFTPTTSELPSPSMEPAAAPQRKRRMAEPPQDVETAVTAWLETQPRLGLELDGDVELREMSQIQLDEIRDMGLAVVVMQTNSFSCSSRTFVLAMSLFDRFLHKSIRVVDIGQTVPGGQAVSSIKTQHGAQDLSIEIPAACFQIACKIVEVFAPRLVDVAGVIDHRASVEQLKDAEKRICRAVEWQIDVVTGLPSMDISLHSALLCLLVSYLPSLRPYPPAALDLVYKLLGFTTQLRQEMIRFDADLAVKVAFCSRKLLQHSVMELAVASLLDA